MHHKTIKKYHTSKPVLLFIRGLPGSGKSYIADALVQALANSDALLIDPDAIDFTDKDYKLYSRELSHEGLDSAIHPFRWLRKKACEGVDANKIVIWNQPFTIRGIFDRLLLFIQENTTAVDLSILIVEVQIDPATAKNRIDKRKKDGGHGPSNTTFKRRIDEYRSFSDGYRTIEVDGDSDVNESVKLILEVLKV